jgi:hypothetical protein
MIEPFQVAVSGSILLGILIGWGITSSYYDYKQGKTIFNKQKKQKAKGGFIQ